MSEVVIVAAKRTAIGTFGGQFKDVSAVELGAEVVKATMESINLDPNEVNEVIFGNVLSAGNKGNIAHQILIHSGITEQAHATTTNILCGSGLKAIVQGSQSILLGDSDVVIAGGTENMSQAPYILTRHRFGQRMGDGQVVDTILHDALIDAFYDYHMGVTAENIVEKYGISRKEQDDLALVSENRAEKAIKSGRFKDEIVPITVPQRKGTPILVDTDEGPRFGQTLESLTKLKPAFKKDGTVTPGNSSAINDGAAAVILMSREKAEALGLDILASLVSYGIAGVDPRIMGTGPIPATQKALEKAKMTVKDIDLIEANEAFAAQALSVIKELGFDRSIVNVNGGAIALGHPVGASGARILVSLIHEMIKRDSKTGLATLCVGGGQGVSVIVQRP